MFGNAEFELIAMCNFYSIFSCLSILKSCELKLYCSLNDRAYVCTVCHMLNWILLSKINNFLKFLSIVLSDQSY